MNREGDSRIAPGICAAILVLAGLFFASSVFAPIAFALFAIVLVWPLQYRLQRHMPRLVALLITLSVTVVMLVALAWLVAWGFGMVGQWTVQNLGRFQALYAQKTQWLEEQGIMLAGMMVDGFDVVWLVRIFQEIASRLHSLTGFALLTFIFMMLGLLEAGELRNRLLVAKDQERGRQWIDTGLTISSKLRRYMLVRTMASLLTGVVIWGFTLFAGMELAIAWGVMAFALNYIPFIGPLVATVFPTLFAFVQFESWQMAMLIFLALNTIQFLIGSYLEPRVAGSKLAVSPFLLMFGVFFWSYMWGIPGAFIGVPLMIVGVTVLERLPATRWMAVILSNAPPRDKPQQ